MKKITIALAAAILALSLGTTTALAHCGRSWGWRQLESRPACSYCQQDGHCCADEDGDGVCDYRAGGAYTDRNGDGVCDHYAEGGHHGRCAW